MYRKPNIHSSNNAFSKETVKQQPRSQTFLIIIWGCNFNTNYSISEMSADTKTSANNSTNVPANISEDLATGGGWVEDCHEDLQLSR
jgi:hypothetical protein